MSGQVKVKLISPRGEVTGELGPMSPEAAEALLNAQKTDEGHGDRMVVILDEEGAACSGALEG